MNLQSRAADGQLYTAIFFRNVERPKARQPHDRCKTRPTNILTSRPIALIVAKQLGVWASTGVDATQVSNTLAQAANASTVGGKNWRLVSPKSAGWQRFRRHLPRTQPDHGDDRAWLWTGSGRRHVPQNILPEPLPQYRQSRPNMVRLGLATWIAPAIPPAPTRLLALGQAWCRGSAHRQAGVALAGFSTVAAALIEWIRVRLAIAEMAEPAGRVWG